MRIYLQLFVIQLKKAIRGIPKQLCGAIVLLSFIGTIAFCGVKMMPQDQAMATIPIGLVVQENSNMVEWAIDFAAGMDSMKGTMDFYRMELTQAYHELEQGTIQAIVILPRNMIEGIVSGNNIPAEIVLKDSNSISSLLLREMAQAGAKILSSAQADIYTVTELYIAAGYEEKLQNAYQQINIRNLRYALSRDRLFQKQPLLATGNYSVILYYCASAISLFLLLFGINCSHLLHKAPPAFATYLRIHNCSMVICMLIKWFVLCLMLLCFSILLGGVAQLMFSFITVEGFLCGMVVLVFVSSYILLCYTSTQTTGGGIVLLFTTSLLGLFLAGAFIPVGFFPETLRVISKISPISYLFQAVLAIVGQGKTTAYVVPLLLSSLFCFSMAISIENSTERRRINCDT